MKLPFYPGLLISVDHIFEFQKLAGPSVVASPAIQRLIQPFEDPAGAGPLPTKRRGLLNWGLPAIKPSQHRKRQIYQAERPPSHTVDF
jgi:hypothetical protein